MDQNEKILMLEKKLQTYRDYAIELLEEKIELCEKLLVLMRPYVWKPMFDRLKKDRIEFKKRIS